MSNYITYEERVEVENCLFNGKSFGEIAKVLGKDRSTISREVRKHSLIERSGYGANGYNACVHQDGFTKVHVCNGSCSRQSLKYCKLCNSCNDNCPDFEERICITRFKPPYVCNSCPERNRCTLEKTVYYAAKAHAKAQAHISESRKGVMTTEQEMIRLNAFVTPLILQGSPFTRSTLIMPIRLCAVKRHCTTTLTTASLTQGTLTCLARCVTDLARRSRSSRLIEGVMSAETMWTTNSSS